MRKYKVLTFFGITLAVVVLATIGIANVELPTKNPEVIIHAFDQNPPGSDKGSE